MFADGALYANAPDLLALHEAEHFFGIPTSEISVFSIGTTTTKFSMSHQAEKNMGVLQWGGRLAQTIISAQQQDAEYIMRHKLGDRYFRIDEVQSKEQEVDLSLDTAHSNAQKTIRGLAEGSVRRLLPDDRLQAILKHTAPEPEFFHRAQD